jgi:hypothetical protein
MAVNTTVQGLNEVQLTLLKLFSRKMSEAEQTEIKEMLLSYYDNALQREVQSVIKKKGYTKNDFEKVLNNSQRTKI